MIRTGFVLMLVGAAGVVGMVRNWVNGPKEAAPAYQEITLRQLAERGPGDNRNVVLTDFAFGRNYVYEKVAHPDVHGAVWVPVLPAGRAAPGPVRVLVKTSSAKSRQEVDSFCRRTTFRGRVVDGDSALARHAHTLRRSYPGTDVSRCLVVEEVPEPEAPRHPLARIWLPGGAFLLGLLLFLGSIGEALGKK